MANSRLERIGTIYSRISGLLRSGAMKTDDKPIWYEIYESFPPKYPPTFERPEFKESLPKLFYPEDQIRAKIHKEKKIVTGVVNLSDSTRLSNTQRCIELYEQLKAEGVDDVQALNEAAERVAVERSTGRVERTVTTINVNKPGIAEEFRRSQKINLGEIMKEK